jgi:RES domain-containing protein
MNTSIKYADLTNLDGVDWESVNATQWRGQQDRKQAEFLIERRFSWVLIEEIGVYSCHQREQVCNIVGSQTKNLQIKIQQAWYY